MNTITGYQLAFIAIAGVTVGAAVMVVLVPNILRAALFLGLMLFGVAGLFVLMNAPFLAGERIYLRPLDADTDLDRCLGWINDPELQARIGRRHPMSRKMEQEWFDGQYKKEDHLIIKA